MKKAVSQSMYGLDYTEQEAIDFLREHEPPEGYQLSFSGGKDSIVMRHLADLAGVNYTALFNCTTIEPPEVYRFIKAKYPDTVWHFPKRKESFFSMLVKKGPAWRKVRWCCQVLKESNNLQGKSGILIGIRSEESTARSKRGRVEDSKYKKGVTYYAPIKEWKEWQIWEHIEKYSLPYPSLYDDGYSRLGCKLCPLTFGPGPAAQIRLERERERFPHFTKRFEKSLSIWWNRYHEKHGSKPGDLSTFDEWLAYYYRGMR